MRVRVLPLDAVLSTTTGKLVSSIGGVYDVCDHMLGRPHMTHELPDAANRATPLILAQYPALAEAMPPDFTTLPNDDAEAACRAWVASVADYIGANELRLTAGEPT